ncbi:MAG: RMD1 family protein [Gammaproteobacteria bacterium]|nr:RMD1 family protein [Gammaproteobacteria bacterium]
MSEDGGFFPRRATGVPARALYLGARLRVRALERRAALALAPLTLRVGEAGCAVVFRYGAVVFFGASDAEEAAFLDELRPYLVEPRPRPEHEETLLRVDGERADTVQGGEVFLAGLDLRRLQLVAEVLARSVVLEYYESRTARSFDLVEPFARRLVRPRVRWVRPGELLVHIGEVLLNQQEMVGRIEIGEKPDLLWEHPGLERLYARLETEYELRERHRALERKLELIARTAETVLEILQARRNLRVEWYIVILIVVEILLSLYEMFFFTHV